jgi:hypothetical protein
VKTVRRSTRAPPARIRRICTRPGTIEGWNTAIRVAATRRGPGPACFCNVLLIRERRGLLVLYPHAVADLAIEMDDTAATGLRDAITDLLA